jgi:hypothetical protein
MLDKTGMYFMLYTVPPHTEAVFKPVMTFDLSYI